MAHAQHPQLTPLEQLNIDIEEATTNYNAMATRGQQIIEIIQGIREREPEGVTDHALELELTLNAFVLGLFNNLKSCPSPCPDPCH